MISRFSSEKEILDTLKPLGSGPAAPVLYEKAEARYSLSGADAEKHTLVCGASRSGKTSRVSIPMVHNILTSNESAIIVDTSRKDVYKAVSGYALKQRSHKVYHLDLTTWESADSYNPLLHIFSQLADINPGVQDQGYRNIQQFARIIVAEQRDDPFWQEAGQAFVSGLLLCLYDLAEDQAEININSLQALCSESLQRVGNRKVLDFLLEMLPEFSKAAPSLSLVANSAPQTAGSVYSVAMSAILKLSVGDTIMDTFNDPQPSITAEELEKGPFLLFLTLPEDSETAIGIVILAQLLNHFIRVADRNNGRLGTPLHILVEELGVVGAYLAQDLPRYTSTCLGRNIKFTLICQSSAQLDHTFGAEGARTIRSNCGVQIHFADYDPSACEQISRMCGNYPLFTSDAPGGAIELPCVRPEEVRALSVGQAIIISGSLMYIAKLPIYTKLFVPEVWSGDPLPFHFREYAHTLHPSKLVEEKRKADLEELQRQMREARGEQKDTDTPKKAAPPSGGLHHMTVPDAIKESRRRRHIRNMCRKDTPQQKPDLWARAARLFRVEGPDKGGSQ